MNKLRIVLWALVALIMGASCTVEHTIDYNEDMSGTNTIVIDYGDVMEQMGGLMGDSMNLGDDLSLKESLGGLEQDFADISGIENLNMISEENNRRMGFSFSFKDTKALNKAMVGYLADDDMEKKKVPKNYKAKRKALILKFEQDDMGSFTEGLGDPSMASMLDMFDYQLTINLPKPVKSVNNSLYTLSEDRKSLSATISFEDMSTGSEDLSAKIKW